jgi:hypothetical protein
MFLPGGRLVRLATREMLRGAARESYFIVREYLISTAFHSGTLPKLR